jgi:YVTN family beta-propeller protein
VEKGIVKMKNYLNVKTDVSMKKTGLIFSGILVLLLIFVSSTASALPFAYVTNSGSNTVSVIDAATNTVTATVDIGDVSDGVAISPDGTKVYVANFGSSHTVTIINTATNRITATVPVRGCPLDVAVTPDGRKLYVTMRNDVDIYSHDKVIIIDSTTNRVTATLTISDMQFAAGLAISPDGRKLYVTGTNEDGGSGVYVVDTATNRVTSDMPVSRGPSGIAVTPNGKQLFVPTFDPLAGVDLLNTATNRYVTTIRYSGESQYYGIAINPAGTKAYVTELTGVSIIDIGTHRITAPLTVGDSPMGIAITPDGTKVYVANYDAGTVSVLETATNRVINTVSVGGRPEKIAIGGRRTLPPHALFKAYPLRGRVPLTVTFTDQSTDSPDTYLWDFGDKSTPSPTKSPVHKYTKAGKYTVSLTVKNKAGSNTKTISNYITVDK